MNCKSNKNILFLFYDRTHCLFFWDSYKTIVLSFSRNSRCFSNMSNNSVNSHNYFCSFADILVCEQIQIKNNHLTLEIIELQSNYDNLTLERNRLQSNYDNLTLETSHLQNRYDNMTLEKNYLQNDYDNLTLKRNDLQSNHDNLTLEINHLQESYDNLTNSTCRGERAFEGIFRHYSRFNYCQCQGLKLPFEAWSCRSHSVSLPLTLSGKADIPLFQHRISLKLPID